MNERKDLSPSEAAVLSALYILGRGTASEIAKISGIYIQTVRNTLLKLRDKGLVKITGGIGSGLFGGSVTASYSGKEKVYELTKSFDEIFEEYRKGFEKWARDLGIEPERLRQMIEEKKKEREISRPT